MLSRASEYTRELTKQEEARLFWGLRWKISLRLADQFLSQSRLRAIVLVLLSGVFWIGMFVLFFEGFKFLTIAIEHEATRAQTVQAIYNIFFLSLLAMLTVSSGIVLYSAVFNSEEVNQLLTSPARAERILLHKFQENGGVYGVGISVVGKSPIGRIRFGIVVTLVLLRINYSIYGFIRADSDQYWRDCLLAIHSPTSFITVACPRRPCCRRIIDRHPGRMELNGLQRRHDDGDVVSKTC